MPDYLAEYVEIVEPIVPLFNDMCNSDHRRAILHHQVGLVNCAIAIQQFIVLGGRLEEQEGQITVARMSGLLASIFHMLSDRMAFMSDMPDDILEAVAEGMHPMIGKVVDKMGVDWGESFGE